jgi:hypothetical protein
MKNALTLLVLLVFISVPCQAQRKQRVPVCRQTTFAAFRALPKLNYDCPESLIESDDKILSLPERLEALDKTTRELDSFKTPDWWQADVAELNACEIHGQAGQLTPEEKENYTSGDYRFGLFGNNSIRMIVVPDPCYQTSYNGSVAFLLYREGGDVFVTRILDGYYSRADNPIGIDYALSNGQQIIEVSTSNTMPPSITNYYFVIDRTTHRAVPRKIFRERGTLTNKISSALLIGNPSELGLPPGANDMQIIKRGRLLPTFSSYSEAFVANDVNARKLNRTIYRWNGRFYTELEARGRRRPSVVNRLVAH